MKLSSTISALCAALLVTMLAVSPVFAGSMTLLGAGEAPVGAGSATFAYQGFSAHAVTGTTENFSGMAVGTAASNRVVAVAILIANAGATVIAPVTIGGVTATQGTGVAGATASTYSDIWYASVPTGTTATVSLTLSANVSGWGIAIGVATINTSTPTAGTGANSQISGGVTTASTTVTIPNGGVAFTGFMDQNNTATFSNMTVDDTKGPGPSGLGNMYFGHQTVTGIATATFTNNDRVSMSTLPWGP